MIGATSFVKVTGSATRPVFDGRDELQPLRTAEPTIARSMRVVVTVAMARGLRSAWYTRLGCAIPETADFWIDKEYTRWTAKEVAHRCRTSEPAQKALHRAECLPVTPQPQARSARRRILTASSHRQCSLGVAASRAPIAFRGTKDRSVVRH